MRTYDQMPERKAAKLAYQQTPEAKTAERARQQTPEAKAVKRAYSQTLEAKAAALARQQTPEAKAVKRAWAQTPEGRASSRNGWHKRRVLKYTLPYIEHDTPMPDDGLCPHCSVSMTGKWPEPNSPSVDHIIPLDSGGHHIPSNTMMICIECNISKGNRPLDVFLNGLKFASGNYVLKDEI